MKHTCKLLLSFLIGATTLLVAQQQAPPIYTSQVNMPLYSVNLAPVTQANTAVVGTPGNTTIYYWMVSNFLLGQSSPIGPFTVPNAVATLTSGNYVQFTPVYPPGGGGVLSVDILKTSTITPPIGACNCAVATGQVSGTVNDQSNATTSYTLSPVNPNIYGLELQNEVQGAGTSHLILRQNGVFVIDLSTGASTSGTVTSVTCGAGLTGGTFTVSGTCALAIPVSVADGGTGTSSPGLIAGTNISVTGSWPNQTINSTGGSGSVNVNGSPVSSPNFNGTTPVAGTNGLNVTYQVTGSNVSAEVVGDGNSGHFLNGIGTYTTPAGGGNLTGTLTPGQRLSASASTTIVSSGPIYDTTNLGVSGGTGIAAHVTYCNTLALATGGTCDMRAEAAQTTLANITIGGNGVKYIFPPVTIAIGSGFDFAVTGNNNTLSCGGGSQTCIVNAAPSNVTASFVLSGTGNTIQDLQILGGRCGATPCSGSAGSAAHGENTISISGNSNNVLRNLISDSGHHGILISNSSFNLIRDNTILRTGDEAILVDTSTSGDFSQNNEIAHNLVEDSNTIPTTDGSISTSCSYSGCFGATDGTNIHDNTVRFLVFAGTICNGNPLTTGATGCKEGIQSTDHAYHTTIHHNFVYNTQNEGITLSGQGGSMTNNFCDGCGLLGSGAGPFMFQYTTSATNLVVGDAVISGNRGTNSTSTQLGYCVSVQDGSSSTVSVTYENIAVVGNICTGQPGSGGFNVGLRFARTSSTDTLTIQNVRFIGNVASDGITTPWSATYGSGTTGVVIPEGNGVNASTDAAPVANDVVAFGSNATGNQPEFDTGVLYPNLVTQTSNATSGEVCTYTGTNKVCVPATALPNGVTATTQSLADNTTKVATDAFVIANAGVTNPMTTLGDDTYGGAAGVFTRLVGPTAPGVYTKTEIPASGAATAETYSLAGVKPNPQTGTTYIYLSTDATQDRAAYTSFSNASAIAATLPQSGSTGFGSNWVNKSCNIGAGTLTITPTTSTISYTTGSTYTSGASSMPLTTGQCAWIYSDNTNYFANINGGPTSACPTCVTSAASLTSGAIMTGAGSQASQTNTTGTGVVTALGVNTGSAGAFAVIIATGTSAMGTGAITSGTCATVVTTTATGATTASTIVATPTADPTGVTGYAPSASGSLYIQAYPTSGNVNFKVCNNTSGTLTPAALTLNWRVF